MSALEIRLFVTAVLLVATLAVSRTLASQVIPANTGTVRGRVHLTGKAPGNTVIRMGTDPKCSQMNRGKQVVQAAVAVDSGGNLANVFVRLDGNFPQAPIPSQPVTITQLGCIYGPRVVGVRVGQVLQIRNDDDVLHNVHSVSTKRNDFNVGQARAGIVFQYKPSQAEVMLRLGCDVHRWMTAYVGVVTNPYFAVSGPMGSFQIDKVPPGTYTIHAWHERYGVTTKTVVVRPGATTTIDFDYAGTENARGVVRE
jgi:hypothetical protein